MSIWKFREINGGWGFVTDIRPYCDYHPQLPMKWGKSKLFELRFPHNDKDAYAIDIDAQCQRCGNTETFGVAVSKEEFELLRKELKRG